MDNQSGFIQERVKYVFVLMLENSSFDHLLGYSGITGNIAGTKIRGSINSINPANPLFNNNLPGQEIYTSQDAAFVLNNIIRIQTRGTNCLRMFCYN